MKFQRHHNFEDIGSQKWNTLVEKSGTDVPFLYYGYLKIWWEFKGGGEWSEDAALEIISAQDEAGFVAIAPLFRAVHEGEETLLLLGSIEISDYLDLIAPPDLMPEFTTGLFSFL